MSENINLYADFGSVFTKVTAIDIDEEKILGTGQAVTTLDTDITDGFNNAVNDLFQKTGEIEFKEKYAVSSALGGLNIVTIGLVPHFTSDASKMAVLGTGARVLKVYSYKLQDEDIDEIQDMDVDIILICGGTDGGNKDNVIYNCEQVARLRKDVSIIYAGNNDAIYECRRILEKTFSDIRITDNVMPELEKLNVEPVRAMIKEIFLEKLIRFRGFIKAQRILTGVVLPTHFAIMAAASILSKGTENEKGIGELLVVDVGASTTDVYSVAKGDNTNEGIIEKEGNEPYQKDTVEGDLGLRYGAVHLAELVGYDILEEQMLMQNVKIDLNEYINMITDNVTYIPCEGKDKAVDGILGQYAVGIATERHVGKVRTSYTEYGASFIQYGKDLSNVGYIIGTGGGAVFAEDYKKVLKGAVKDEEEPSILKPKKPKILIDKSYIMYSLGMLAETYPDTACRMLKKYLEKI